MQVGQYVCSRCDAVLKETAQYIPFHSLREECPSCGSMLAETLTRRTMRPPTEPPPKLQTADTLRKLKFDIPKIDSFVNLAAADLCCISGPGADQLVTRLCVRSLLPRRHGGLGSPYVVVADCGNRTDVYRTISFARQYGMDKENVADRILVVRAFTVHQVRRLLSVELPKLIHRHQIRGVFVPGLLNTIYEEPGMKAKEARKEIGKMAKALEDLSRNLLVVTSIQDGKYSSSVLPRFKKRVRLGSDGSYRLAAQLYNDGDSKTVGLTEKEITTVTRI